MRFLRTPSGPWVIVSLVFASCIPNPSEPRGDSSGVTPEKHSWFPLTRGAHAMGTSTASGPIGCASCHPPGSESFTQFTCTNCHEHDRAVTDRLHLGEPAYAYASSSCLSCHPAGEKVPFTHTGITSQCAMCHDVGAVFAALPVPGFTHPPMGGADCSGCHLSFTTWKGAAGAPVGESRDPNADVVVDALIPSWSGTTITRVTPHRQTLPMQMNHLSSQVPASLNCQSCHTGAASGSYYPGVFHASLSNAGLPQPTSCSDCHRASTPVGFVGPLATNPPRNPASGEMRHDAVLWQNGAPTKTSAVPQDCSICHASPRLDLAATWANGRSGNSAATFHAALTAVGQVQPTSCLDCHANTRPNAVLTSANAALPAGVSFDHASAEALGDCVNCHARSASTASWTGGVFHATGSQTPKTCANCHEGQRPTSTSNWKSTTYQNAPFDYVTNANGVAHGAGLDCVVCHNGPGTGAWGGTQNWVGGFFPHGPNTIAAQTCVACHTTQRPTSVVAGFDHSKDGTGECFGCHQATVAANRYNTLADWQGGIAYPGSTFIASSTQFVRLSAISLVRSPATNLVTGTTTVTQTLYNGMLHDSSLLPSELNAGPTGNPDSAKCWHCHTHNNGTVTQYSGGVFHASLTNFRATPTGQVMPLPQPAKCNDCHKQMLPKDIVQKAGSTLQPMDHAAKFAQPVVIGGVTVSGVPDMDCGSCHKSPGATWNDGIFHASIGAAVPQDCVSCHYPLMADGPKADVANGTQYRMQHRSSVITHQACQTCHAAALGKATTTPPSASLWRLGTFHPNLANQPSACIDCHAVSEPPPNAPTQSNWTYVLAMGGTPTNGRQWMNHGSPFVAGRDCAACHAADAKKTGSAWSKSTLFHAAVANVTSCKECHGTANGGGTTIGTNNNLPVGLTNSDSITTASPSTGVPTGTLDQVTHADINVSSKDCNFCHTQVGISSAPSIQGKEWAQANLHAPYSGAIALVMNGTTGRCSNCHMNVKPGPTYPGFDHSAFTSAPGTQDCVSCHALPGTGTPASPNWKGAAGAPLYMSVGGFTIAVPPAPSAGIVQAGINNLPHPSNGACTDCHATASGGRRAKGYDHASTLVQSNCRACHEAGSDLVATPWATPTNAVPVTAVCKEGRGTILDRGGDTRPVGLTSLACSDIASTRTCGTADCVANHFYPADCRECHNPPTGVAHNTTGTAFASAWQFPHIKANMKPTTCCMCHRTKPDGTCKP